MFNGLLSSPDGKNDLAFTLYAIETEENNARKEKKNKLINDIIDFFFNSGYDKDDLKEEAIVEFGYDCEDLTDNDWEYILSNI